MNIIKSNWKSSTTCYRSLYTSTGIWPDKLTKELQFKIEAAWKNKISSLYEQQASAVKKNKYYVLSMFPYPSGNLHLGHVRVYTISDIMARYHRMKGEEVIHPMGWDAFGLPAENAAIARGEPPDKWTHANIKKMKQQLKDLCFNFDWSREYATCDPSYYKWTQYLFLKLYEHGLVYQKQGAVNWDPVDQTVLANEQVDENGRAWRSGALVEKKYLKQWYIRSTAYCESLYNGLNEVDPEFWKEVAGIQKALIGECSGMTFQFNLYDANGHALEQQLDVYTEHYHCIYGVSHFLLSSDHFFNDKKYYEQGFDDNSAVIPLTVKVKNPFNGHLLPVFIHKNFDFEERDTHTAIPTVNTEDLNFTREQNLDYVNVLDNDCLINSNQFNGLTKEQIKDKLIKKAKSLKCGGYITSAKSQDWLVSRQRYWGTPIPMMHCPKYGTMPVSYDALPVELPKLSSFSSSGRSPLCDNDSWYKVKCDRCDCDSYALRETDTLDTFVDSSWYYLRYLDSNNQTEPFSKQAAHNNMPVDLYIGGIEHAAMHLYFARFIHHFLHDLGLTPTQEPFINLLTQGMVLGPSYTLNTGQYISKDEVDFTGKHPVQKDTSERVTIKWEKMSKSKYNGVEPQHLLDEYGIDATRLCMVYNVSPRSPRKWSDELYVGVNNWQARIWKLVTNLVQDQVIVFAQDDNSDELESYEQAIFEARNEALIQVNHAMQYTFSINAAISRLQTLTNVLNAVPRAVAVRSPQYARAVCDVVVVLAPFMPMLTSEMWRGLASVTSVTSVVGQCHRYHMGKNVLDQTWPEVDSNYRLKLRVKVNEKEAYTVQLDVALEETAALTKNSALQQAISHNQYQHFTHGYSPKHVQFTLIPGVKAVLNLEIAELKKEKISKKKRVIAE